LFDALQQFPLAFALFDAFFFDPGELLIALGQFAPRVIAFFAHSICIVAERRTISLEHIAQMLQLVLVRGFSLLNL